MTQSYAEAQRYAEKKKRTEEKKEVAFMLPSTG
jgi:hypothetical protein